MRVSAPSFPSEPVNAKPLGRRSSGAWQCAVLGAIIAVGAVLRFLYLARKSFWLDEGVSVAIARLDWGNLLHILWRREANMALYYGLLRMWLHLGSSEFFVRSLSAVLSLAAIPAIYLLGKALFDRNAGLIAAALLGVHAWHIRYAQEARSYSLFILLAVIASLFYVRAFENPSRRNWWSYVVLSALAVYSHFFAVLLIAAQWTAIYFVADRKLRAQFLHYLKFIALLVAPIVVFIVARGMGPISWIPRPGGSELHRFALDLTGNGGDLLLLVYGLTCGLAVISAFRGLPLRTVGHVSDQWRYVFLLCWLVVPVAITLVFSLIRPAFLPRYLVVCIPALVLLAAEGIRRVPPRWAAAGLLIILVALSARGVRAYYRADFDLAREDWRSATAYVLANSRANDGVLFHSAQARLPFEYYADARAPREQVRVIFPAYGPRLTYQDFLANAKNADLTNVRARYPRVWLVLAHNRLKDGQADSTTANLQSSLANGYTELSRQEFGGGISVILYGSGPER